MPTISDIANLDQYKGTAELGGSGALAINIDTRPIQQLAQYTFLYNKSQYDQRQKDADQKIKEIGALAPYDLINGIEKDANEVKDAQAKLTDYLAEYAAKGTPNSPKEKIQQELDLQKNISGQLKLINAANSRKIKLDKYTDAVQSNSKLSADQKELKINNAKKLFDNTDIYTLPDIPETDLTIPKIGEPVMDKTVSLTETPNGIIKEQKDQWSFAGNNKVSYLEANNLMLPVLPQNATQQQKDEYEEKKLAYSKNDVGIWKLAQDAYANAFNDPKYKKPIINNENAVYAAPSGAVVGAEIDINKIKQDNPIIGGILSIGERYNNYAKERIQQIQDGYYIDKVTGYKVRVEGGDTVEDIQLLDLTKPLSDADLIKLRKFSVAQPDKVEKTYTHTGDANTLRNIQLDYNATIAGQRNQKSIAELPYLYAKITSGKATKDEKSDYPVLKTQELVETIGVNGTPIQFSTLTPAQQSKIQSEGVGKITDISTVSIEGNKIKVTGTFTDKKDKKATAAPVTITIIPDDITKAYYDEINKNDAGKEAPERKYFKFGDTKQAADKSISDYSTDIQAGIKAFMKANNLDEKSAIKYLKDNGKIQ